MVGIFLWVVGKGHPSKGTIMKTSGTVVAALGHVEQRTVNKTHLFQRNTFLEVDGHLMLHFILTNY